MGFAKNLIKIKTRTGRYFELKIMVITGGIIKANITLNGKGIEQVETFKYLSL